MRIELNGVLPYHRVHRILLWLTFIRVVHIIVFDTRDVYIDNKVQDVNGKFGLCLQLAAYGNDR